MHNRRQGRAAHAHEEDAHAADEAHESAAGMFYASQGLALLGAGVVGFNPFAGDSHP